MQLSCYPLRDRTLPSQLRQIEPHMSNWTDPIRSFKWPVRVTRPIEASPDRVWITITEPGYLERCHPFCAANPVQEWPGEHSRDEVHYLNGWIFERRFCRWIEGVGYDLEIGRAGGRSSFVSWRISHVEDRSCTLSIVVCPHVLQGIPTWIRWAPHHLRVRPLLTDYLDSVIRGVGWYVTRGEPVAKNQFGSHAWFSEAPS